MHGRCARAIHEWVREAERLPAFNDNNLRHLLRRTEFVVRPQRLLDLQASGSIEAAVDDVLAIALNNPRDGLGPVGYFDDHIETNGGWEQYQQAAAWGIDYAARGTSQPHGPPPPATFRALQEKMVLFWHGHLVTSWSQIHLGVQLMWQLHGYRRRALGNLVDVVQEMAVSPAMLVYLSNAFNNAAEPNQNFARELMELFTLGVGNYSEDDVDAVARAWTGHNYSYDQRRYYFDPIAHDFEPKTLFGITRDWDGPQVIGHILVENPGKQLVSARFLARKLWEFFGFVGPTPALVDDLAEVLIANGMELAPLMRALLLRDEFYSTQSRQGLVRAPLEWIVALAYHANMPGADFRLIEPEFADHGRRAERSAMTGQLVFQPPNVSGWRPNEYWMTSSGLSGRGSARHNGRRLRPEQPRRHAAGVAGHRGCGDRCSCCLLRCPIPASQHHTGGDRRRLRRRRRRSAGRRPPRTVGADDDQPRGESGMNESPIRLVSQPELTRRRFLQAIGAGALVGATGRAFGPISVAEAAAAAQLEVTPIGATDGVLVLVTLYGGNDGLNTVVPFTNGNYFDARNTLAIDPAACLPLDDRYALHPALPTIARMWHEGHVAVVHGVGYNPPNRSHFASTANWMSGRYGPPNYSTGWIGRWLDSLPAEAAGLAVAEVGITMPLHLRGGRADRSPVAVPTADILIHPPVGSRMRNALSAISPGTATERGALGDGIAAAMTGPFGSPTRSEAPIRWRRSTRASWER